MSVVSRRALKTFVRIVWGTSVFLVIFLAACVQLGRTAFPYLNDYKAHFENQLSKRLNANITVGKIDASWNGLRPAISLIDVNVSGGPHSGQLQAKRLSAQINLLATFKDWRLALGKLDFEGLKAELIQAQDGSWAIAGLPETSASNSDFTIDDPLDIFLFGRRLELNQTSIVLRFSEGQVTDMVIPYVSLENDANFHRLKAKVDVDDDSNALYFVVEGQGDPRDDKNFDAKGYLQLQRFPLQKVAAATGLHQNFTIEPSLWSDTSQLDFQLWFSGSTSKGVIFNGGGKASGLPFKLPGEASAPAIPQFKFTGQWDKTTGLFAQLGNFGLSWPNTAIPPLDIEMRAGINQPAEFRIRELDVTAWSQAIGDLKLNNVIANLQENLQPAGKLRDIGITILTPEQGYFNLRANLQNGAVQSWQGSPEVNGAVGFIETTAFKGRIVVEANDGFSMHYPIVYKKPLDFYEASGEVAWFVDLPGNKVSVTSGLLKLRGESGEGVGYLSLNLPTKHIDGIEPEMTLAVGMRESVARYHDAYIPYTIPESLYRWLGQSIKEGDLTDGGFIYRGSLLKEPLRPRSLQLSMKIHSGELAFDPAWPVLKNADATLLVDDLNLAVAIEHGELAGNTLQNGRVELVKTEDQKVALSITGDAFGNVADALTLLHHSPVNSIAGEALNQFSAEGPYQGKVELFIPLDGGVDAGWQNIEASVRDVKFVLPEIGLTFFNLKTDIHYHSKVGLTAKNIHANLWQKPFSGDLKTLKQKEGRILQLDFKGSADINDLKQWINRPIFNYMSGIGQASGTLVLPFDHPAQGIDLTVISDLKGVGFSFPKPYSKLPSSPKNLKLTYQLPRNSSNSKIAIATDDVNTEILMNGGNLLAMDVGFDEQNQIREGSLRLHGELGHIDASDWGDFIFEYIAALESLSTDSQNTQTKKQVKATKKASPPKAAKFSMGVHAKSVSFDSLVVDDVAIWGRELEDFWYFDLETPMAIANYQRFNDGRESQLHFEYLHLPNPEIADPSREKQSVIANAALEKLDATDVRIDELAFGSDGWGHVAFNFRPERNGLLAKNIKGNLRGLKTTDGTLAIYKRSESEWESSFSGVINTADIGSVLQNFDYPKALVSESTQFDVSLNWPGYPDQLALDSLSGTVDLKLNNGHFIQSDAQSDKSGFLKLISLLNFDTLVRRLRLDFSDLHPEGLTYDRVTGKLYFENKTIKIKTETPLTVDTTSADLELTGDIYLSDQTLDSQLVATLPIAGNLAVAAALTAGLPAAVGVYIVGKLFKDQVEQLASVRYNVTGSWDDPKLEVDKIFERHAAKEKTDSALKKTQDKPPVSH